jgi:hypothetical protein
MSKDQSGPDRDEPRPAAEGSVPDPGRHYATAADAAGENRGCRRLRGGQHEDRPPRLAVRGHRSPVAAPLGVEPATALVGRCEQVGSATVLTPVQIAGVKALGRQASGVPLARWS